MDIFFWIVLIFACINIIFALFNIISVMYDCTFATGSIGIYILKELFWLVLSVIMVLVSLDVILGAYILRDWFAK